MSERDDRFESISRRSFLKAGTLLTLVPSIHLAALPGQLAQPAEGIDYHPEIDPGQPPPPEWIKNLIIYEVATKGFTSPNGPQSGTFASLRSKLQYLHELGINGLWLSGYSLCDSRHFYNIWTQYAVIEPDKLDPTLGSAEQFKALIDDAHRLNIKVFLDVITHGLMKDSPVIRRHPSWFRGGSWGMTDFDWDGGHIDLDDWWVKIYTNFVTAYGVDGYRLDVDIYRPDLWERIRRNATAAGHPIVIFEENNSVIRGVTDFTQRQNPICIDQGPDRTFNEVLVNDLPGFYDRKFGRAGYYRVEVRFEGCDSLEGDTKGNGPLGVQLIGLSDDRLGPSEPKPDGLPDVRIRLQNVTRKPIADITVRNDMGEQWQLRPGGRPLIVDAQERNGSLVVGPLVDIYIATLSWGASILLSCHDNGWEGFPLDENPFVAQGSRSLFGYSFLFSPMIPLFFSGEEFDATFHPLPELSPYLFGGKDPGKGRWLYGGMLDWNELSEAGHRDMLADVKKMIAIRKQHPEALANWPPGRMPNLKAVRHEADIDAPVPYARWDKRAAIMIAGNRDRERDALAKLHIDPNDFGLGGHSHYAVTDLWLTGNCKKYAKEELADFKCTIRRDGTPGGGLSVFKIEPA